MTRVRLKYKFVPLFIVALVLIPVVAIVLGRKDFEPSSKEILKDEFIPSEILPVINNTKKIINPYTSQNVEIANNYYDYKADEEKQLNSIIIQNDMYIQNTGIDYTSKDQFDIVAVLEGTIVSVKEDEINGKCIEIKHDNDYITIYQGLSEVSVKKGEVVSQGQLLGKSGTDKQDQEMINHLHFEVYKNGQPIDPNGYLNSEVKSQTEKEN